MLLTLLSGFEVILFPTPGYQSMVASDCVCRSRSWFLTSSKPVVSGIKDIQAVLSKSTILSQANSGSAFFSSSKAHVYSVDASLKNPPKHRFSSTCIGIC